MHWNWRRLRRVTSSGKYSPEIDGLRFLAIMSVFVFHVAENLAHRDPAHWSIPLGESALAPYVVSGDKGVHLFFVISGLVLGLPFAAHALRGGSPVSLRSYFARRVTRLEPPYVVAMLGCYLVLRALAATDPPQPGNLLASLFYGHGLVYGEPSLVNNVAWSLEVEIQFYLLVPVLTMLYRIRRAALRRGVFIALVLGAQTVSALLIEPGSRPSLTILYYAQFFLLGLFCADLHVSGVTTQGRRTPVADATAVVLGGLTPWLLTADLAGGRAGEFLEGMLLLPTIMALYWAAFRGVYLSRLLSIEPLPVIGGMCYTIYLLHNIGQRIVLTGTAKLPRTGAWDVDLIVQVAAVAVPVLIPCVIFFVLIERPCMNPHWVSDLLARLRGPRLPVDAADLHADARVDPARDVPAPERRQLR
ncbi:MAG: acyltransferase [Austwickia sp.]|nr:acyltransferase [Austwickia sp.]MBK8436516.1 acyltransferase [Austwickia sp.]